MNKVILLFACLLFLGCNRDPYANSYLTEAPDSSQLIGAWGGQGSVDSWLELKEDMSFKASNYPSGGFSNKRQEKAVLDGSGSWSLEKHQWFYVVRLTWKEIDGSPTNYGKMIHIRKTSDDLSLWEIFQDPDLGEGVGMRRMPEPLERP